MEKPPQDTPTSHLDSKKPRSSSSPSLRQEGGPSVGSGYAIGLSFASNVFVGVLFGLGVDFFFQTKPWFLLLFLAFGIAAGFRVIWVYLKNQPISQRTPKK